VSNAYDAIIEENDHTRWAFGTGFDDPLAGVDPTVPDGMDAADLAAYCLMLGDDALIMSHRLSEWCTNAPELEDEVALANRIGERPSSGFVRMAGGTEDNGLPSSVQISLRHHRISTRSTKLLLQAGSPTLPFFISLNSQPPILPGWGQRPFATGVTRYLDGDGGSLGDGAKIFVEVRPEEISLEATLANLGITREQLVDMGLLIGTDFNEGVRGIGPKKALALIKKHGALEGALAELGVDIESKDEVRKIFLFPNVLDHVEIAFRDPDPDGVRKMLCDEFDFSRERIDAALVKFGASRSEQKQRSLDAWFG